MAATDEPVGGEVRIGRGPAPGFLRWFNYGAYAAGALYLFLFLGDAGGHPVVVVAGVLMVAWLVYIVVGTRPPEP